MKFCFLSIDDRSLDTSLLKDNTKNNVRKWISHNGADLTQLSYLEAYASVTLY